MRRYKRVCLATGFRRLNLPVAMVFMFRLYRTPSTRVQKESKLPPRNAISRGALER